MNRKKLIPLLAVLVLAAVIAVAAIINSRRNMHSFTGTLYFFNDTQTSISDENREIRYKSDLELPHEVIEALLKGPRQSKLRRTIDRNVELLSVDMRDPANIVVDFSEEYISGDAAKDILKTYSIVKSLCEIYYVNSVKVVVGGEDIITSEGVPIGYLTAADINLATDTNTSETREIKLYFKEKDSNLLSPEMRTIKVTDQQPLEQYIINELIKGPDNKEHAATLSKDTVLLSVDVAEDICFVNFKSSFIDKNAGSQDKEILTVYSIVDSLTELESISRVQFLIDGKKTGMFGTLNISSMFGRNSDMIGE